MTPAVREAGHVRHPWLAEFEQAPAIDSDLAGDPEWIQEHRRQTQEYWEHHREG